MLKSEHITIYHKVDDPIYDSFREHIKQRDEFNNHVKEIQLNDRIKIWRTERDIEKDCKEKLAKYEREQERKSTRMYRIMTCQWCRKKPISKEEKQENWLKQRNNRILR